VRRGWQAVRSRPFVCAGVVTGLAAWLLLSNSLPLTTCGILAWSAGVLLFLVLSTYLFATETLAAWRRG
jgi:EamA domain-containing membrane protein RarD